MQFCELSRKAEAPLMAKAHWSQSIFISFIKKRKANALIIFDKYLPEPLKGEERQGMDKE